MLSSGWEDLGTRPYQDTSDGSGIIGYELGEDFIDVYFADHACHRYSNLSVGVLHVESMKALAELGQGLGAYMQAHPAVRTGYMVKLR